MKYIIVVLIVIIAAAVLIGCSKAAKIKEEGSGMSSYKSISPEEVKAILEQKKNIILLDVRTQSEYEERHIKGSTLLPLDKLPRQAEELLEDKEAQIIVYCRSGNRSKTASSMLVDMGYKNIYNLGGITNWPYETETGK